MVKRAIALFVGALGAALLWYGVLWARNQAYEGEVISVDTCDVGFDISCVGYPAPAVKPAPEPCKAWLADSRAGVAALSQCLHGARTSSEAAHIKAFERAQAIRTSS